MYPFFVYRAGSYSFDFSTTLVTNDTHDYGNKYQFPSSFTSTDNGTPTAAWPPGERFGS
jgi:hypothetical protein